MARRRSSPGPPSDAEPGFVDSTAVFASLYQGEPESFIARRRLLAADLKRRGHLELAGRIAVAAKPSRVAALMNDVYWQHRERYDAVLEAGTAARSAQQARLLGDVSADVAGALRLRERAVSAAVAAAVGARAPDGPDTSPAIVARVREGFEALAAQGREARLPHGQLVEPVPLPGLAALAGLTLPPEAPPGVVAPRRLAIVARRAESEDAAAPSTPDTRLVEAEAQVAGLRERAAATAERLDGLRRALASAEEIAVNAERQAAAAARTAETARKTATTAAAGLAGVEAEALRAAGQLADAERQLEALRRDLTPT